MLLGIKIPATAKAFYKTSQISGNRQILDTIQQADYYKYITKYSELAKIPRQLLVTVVAIESAGKNAPKNSWGAIGLTQMKWGTAYDTIKKEVMDKTLTDSDKAFIKQYVPSLAKDNFKVKYGDFTGIDKPKVIKELEIALTKPQFNLLMGALHIGQLIDKFTTFSGKPMLHQSLAIYNQGIGRTTLVKPYTSIDDLINKSNLAKEGKDYVLKALGTNGYLDLLTK